ncbi:hypothetical protein GV794_25960 [Nocardia cyriacigeorgica]|uniref:Uncharacterized protein n=1 Tax=Nocardia cyriacigeorgica TaxID=135487 RepID=A0ABX0CZ76_9NOCA|nr:hypothetical protein [Nocardia cyriacigeorgica]NEW42427.1 hypothetical protein [Nocardia cyriacigeorgica]NEW52606.1 hypothetical protein [Nocardia cyriacigeorgica]NEW59057.1 hypothetical protein [Nocardia cyriacigeorgica]
MTLFAALPASAAAEPAVHTKDEPTVCTATPNNPHRSGGAGDGRVIFKTRVICNKTATVKIQGVLLYAPTADGKPTPVTSSEETRTIQANKAATFYTPDRNDRQVKESGYYQGLSVGQIINPQGTIGKNVTTLVRIG